MMVNYNGNEIFLFVYKEFTFNEIKKSIICIYASRKVSIKMSP